MIMIIIIIAIIIIIIIIIIITVNSSLKYFINHSVKRKNLQRQIR